MKAESEGRKSTRQKESILNCLSACGAGHLTAEELLERLKRSNTPVSRATVYRYLTELESSGQVRRYLGVEGAPACFEYLDEEERACASFHLLCDACGQVVHFKNEDLEAAFERMASESGIVIDERRLVFYGSCAQCAKAAEEKLPSA